MTLVYLALALGGLAGAGWAVYRSEQRRALAAMAIVAAAVIILADWIAFGWFHLYHYRPYLLQNPLADSALGELLADLIFVPGLTLLMLQAFPGLPGILLGTGVVTILEVVFVRLGIFFETGWPVAFTVLGFPIYFFGLNAFWSGLCERGRDLGRFRLFLRACLIFDLIGLLTLYLRGGQLVATNLHIMPTHIGNQALGRFIWYVLPTVPVGLWALDDRRGWLRVSVATGGFLLLNVALQALGIQRFVPPWNAVFDALAQGLCIFVAGRLTALVVDGPVRQLAGR